MSASEDLVSALAAFYAGTIRPDVEVIVRTSTKRLRVDVRRQLRATEERLRDGLRGEMAAGLEGVRDGLRGEMGEMEGRLLFEIRERDRQGREDLLASIDTLRRDMNGHFDAVHQKLGHLETEYRMLVVGVRRLEAARPPDGT